MRCIGDVLYRTLGIRANSAADGPANDRLRRQWLDDLERLEQEYQQDNRSEGGPQDALEQPPSALAGKADETLLGAAQVNESANDVGRSGGPACGPNICRAALVKFKPLPTPKACSVPVRIHKAVHGHGCVPLPR